MMKSDGNLLSSEISPKTKTNLTADDSCLKHVSGINQNQYLKDVNQEEREEKKLNLQGFYNSNKNDKNFENNKLYNNFSDDLKKTVFDERNNKNIEFCNQNFCSEELQQQKENNQDNEKRQENISFLNDDINAKSCEDRYNKRDISSEKHFKFQDYCHENEKNDNRKINDCTSTHQYSDSYSKNLNVYCNKNPRLVASMKHFGSNRLAELMRFPYGFESPAYPARRNYSKSVEHTNKIIPAGKETEWNLDIKKQFRRQNTRNCSTQVAKNLQMNNDDAMKERNISVQKKKNDSINTQMILQLSRPNEGERSRLLYPNATFVDHSLIPEIGKERLFRRLVQNVNLIDHIKSLIQFDPQDEKRKNDDFSSKSKKILPHTVSYQTDKLIHNRFESEINKNELRVLGKKIRKCSAMKEPNPCRWGINVLDYALPTPKNKKHLNKETNLDWNFVPFKSSDEQAIRKHNFVNVSHIAKNFIPLQEYSQNEKASGIKAKPDKMASRLEASFVPKFQECQLKHQVNPQKNYSQLEGALFIPVSKNSQKGKKYSGMSERCQIKTGSCKLLDSCDKPFDKFLKVINPIRNMSNFSLSWEKTDDRQKSK